MKIPGSDGTTGKLTVQDGLGLGGNARGVRDAKGRVGSAIEGDNQAKTQGIDLVTVSPLALLMGEELDPTKMADERKRRVEELKARIAKGEYNPDSGLVAAAVSEELSLEILFAGSQGSKLSE